ncbi:MAG TPA: hypothetical protein VJ962_04930 [Clostridia bacterium]|nr:hypothetical protein [Clostridia bacterium]
MDIQKSNNMNRILYSSYRSHHSTTNKIERTENTFANQLSESNNYLTIIDEFYHSLRQKRDRKRQAELFHKYPINQIIDLIVDLVNSYNEHYLKLLNHDNKYETKKHIKIKDELKKFEFNLSQIGIRISQRNLLKVNTNFLKEKLKDSCTYADFIFEKNGLIEHLQELYEERVIKNKRTHFDKKG